MSLNIIVLAKQVPDTRNVGAQAMNADGTINRSALPAIFNPDDLGALEQALQLKEKHPGSHVTVLTMGPRRAAELLREALYRGADEAVLCPTAHLRCRHIGYLICTHNSYSQDW